MNKLFVGFVGLVGALLSSACGNNDKPSSPYCCINKAYYSCTEQGALKCFQTLGSDVSGCTRDNASDSKCQ